MYTDTILFLAGGLCALLAVCFAAYLILSRKRSRAYQALLQQDTEAFSSLSTTGALSWGSASNPLTDNNTEPYETSQPVQQYMAGMPSDSEKTEYYDDGQQDMIDFDASAL